MGIVWLGALVVAGAELPPLPKPLGVPAPGAATDGPYAPQPILPGGVVIPLYPAGSPQLKAERVKEAEVYSMGRSVAGRINYITNIHNPSIEVHRVDGSINTGAAIILAAGGWASDVECGERERRFRTLLLSVWD